MTINIHKYPSKDEWKKLLQRPVIDTLSLEAGVSNILKEVKENGDSAVKRFSSIFDKANITEIEVLPAEVNAAKDLVSHELKLAIEIAKSNIEKFHRPQLRTEEEVEVAAGIRCWRKSVPIERVGLYIPGGTAPLFSTILMLGIPARLAGCRHIVLCSPPDKKGGLHPAILYAADVVGINKIYKVGGVQAIGAMAYGTTSIPKVHKIFGPGNQYVTAAKQLVQKEGVAIDMPAGPSEIAIFADETANAAFIAADLLSQAEHGSDSHVLLVTLSEQLADEVNSQIEKQLPALSRKEIATKALQNSKIIVMSGLKNCIELLNEYAPEHLILMCNGDEQVAAEVTNAGSVFLGHYSPESAGDYASGTNHTLPTNGYSKAYSGVSVDSFVKKITFQKLSREGLSNIGDAIITLAKEEGLDAHARAVEIRLNGDYS